VEEEGRGREREGGR